MYNRVLAALMPISSGIYLSKREREREREEEERNDDER